MSGVYVPPESLLESRAFRRLLAFSLGGHILLFAVLTFRPHGHAELISPSPVMVNVVQAPPQAQPQAKPAPPKAAPKPPPPKPPPPPPKPVVNEVVIPKEPAPLPVKPKPAPKPAPKPETPPKTAEQLLAELTEKVEAEHPDQPPLPSAPVGPAAPIAGGAGTFDPLLSPWVRRVQSVVQANWSGAQLCKGVPKFDVDVDASGALSDIELSESSGDRFCDEAAERALRKSNPLPPPPRGAMSVTLELSQKGNM